MDESQILPLEQLSIGQIARIAHIDGDGVAVARLAEMGMQVGVAIRMVRPGRPCILAVGNHRLSFRGDETASILVEICNGAGVGLAGNTRAHVG